MEAKVFSTSGEEIRNINLSDAVFKYTISNGAIYYAIRNENANKRVGTASAKTRSEIRGTTAKPWRQKGTGRARAGTRKSPIWVGGGVSFGPKPKDYSYHIPRKMKRAAMKSIISLKTQEEKVKIVEDFSIESGKTRDLMKILKNFVADENTVLVLHENDALLKRAGRNIPWLKFLAFNRLSAHDLYYGKNILILESAALKLGEFFDNSVN